MPEPAPGGAVLGLGDSISCGPEEGAFGVPPARGPSGWPRPWTSRSTASPAPAPSRRTSPPSCSRAPRDDYALACVHVGTNDVRAPGWDPGAYAEALERILAALAPRAQRLCLATLPLDLGRPRAGVKVAELNAIVRAAAARHDAAVADLDDLRGWRLVFPDAVHPTALGQLEIAERAAAALGLTARPAAIAGAVRGPRADLRYALTRQPAHLLRDRRRRWAERARPPGR